MDTEDRNVELVCDEAVYAVICMTALPLAKRMRNMPLGRTCISPLREALQARHGERAQS